MGKRRVVPMLVVMLILPLAVGCGGDTARLCCNDRYPDIGSVERNYCLDHAVAARLYIQEPDSLSDREARLQAIEQLAAVVQTCTSLDCVIISIDTSSATPGFKEIFVREHAKAEDELDMPADKKVEAIKCALDHAIRSGVGQ